MTQRINPHIILAILSGAGVSCALAFTSPQFAGAGLAFAGGICGGASIVEDARRKSEKKKEANDRVTTTFTALYETNRGLIDPIQLGCLAGITTEQAHGFLTNLAEQTGGSKIHTKQGVGVAFVFPHTAAVLDELTNNAQNWAQAQIGPLVAERDSLATQMRLLQLQQKANLTPSDPQKGVDPWNKVNP